MAALHRNAHDRFTDWLIHRFSLRGHMVIILIATTLAGAVTNSALYLAGVVQIVYRYPICVTIAYVVFFILIKIWLKIILPGHRGRAEPTRSTSWFAGSGSLGSWASDKTFSFAPGTSGGGGKFSGAGASSSWSESSVAAPGSSGSGSASGGGSSGNRGMALIAAGLMIIAFVGAAIYFVWYSPVILADAAFQAAFAAGLIHHSKTIRQAGWIGSVFKETCVPFYIVLGFAFFFGWIVHQNCPQNTRFSEVITRCEK